jgi:hypothetical protein
MFADMQFSHLRVLAVTGLVAAASFAALDAGAASPASRPAEPSAANRAQVAESYGKLPLSFEANQGQVDKQVKFFSRGNGYSLFLTNSSAVLALSKGDTAEGGKAAPGRKPMLSANSVKTDVIRMELAGASRRTQVSGAERLPGTANYFIGNDPSRWRSGVPTYAKVRYMEVYPGVDLVYYGNQRQLEYDFVVAPGADPRPIRLHFNGAKALRLDADGDLAVVAANGEIAFHKPVLYQEKDGGRVPVEGRFALLGKNTVGFTLGRYDRAEPLVIDPVLAYSTYLGGSGGDYASAIAVDAAGNAYVTGTTFSTDFPLKNAHQKTNNGAAIGVSNAFVAKVNPSGTALLYSTYLGGSGNTVEGNSFGDSGYGIAVDSSGDAYVTGQACSTNFPTTDDAVQTVNNAAKNAYEVGCNAFVAKLNPTGGALLYSTYLGGSGRKPGDDILDDFTVGDSGTAIAVDGPGDAYVTGYAQSYDFPVTPGVVQPGNHAAGNGQSNAYVAKLNPTGTKLLYSTCLGGSGSTQINVDVITDSGSGIAVDGSGNAYVTGYSLSTDFPHFPKTGAFQPVNNAAANDASNAFVAKLNPEATQLIYSTYLGGSGHAYYMNERGDTGSSIAVDLLGRAFVTGRAFSTDFPTTKGAFQTGNKGGVSGTTNAFVAKFNPSGTALEYSTYLGGSGLGIYQGDSGSGIAIDGSGDAYVTGAAASTTDFPVTSDAYQSVNSGTFNAFVSKLDPTGSALIYSTYLGGSAEDYGNGIALGSTGDTYVAGQAFSSNFPVTMGALQITNKGHAEGNSNAFVAKLAIGGETTTNLTSSMNPAPEGVAVTFTANVVADYGAGIPTGNVVFSVDGTQVATVALGKQGNARYTTSFSTEAKYAIQAAYEGAGGYATSTSSLTETISSPTPPPATPVISPDGATFAEVQPVTIADSTPGAVIYFTTNGTAPSASSTKYTGPITVGVNETINAIAVWAGHPNSEIATAAYIIAGSPTVVAAPATAIGTATATMHAVVNTFGLAGTYVFQFGTNPASLATTNTRALTGSAAPVTVSVALPHLTTKTTYYYRAVATTAGGIGSGAVVSFTTE